MFIVKQKKVRIACILLHITDIWKYVWNLQNYNLDIHARDDDGWILLHCTRNSGNIELLQYVIEKWGNPYSESKKNMILLHAATIYGHLNLCEALLKYFDFDIHARDDYGWTALHCAAIGGDLQVFQFFLKNGSNVCSKTKESFNCLHLAAYNRHLKMCINLLQNYNFDILARDDDGWTGLHKAAKSGNIELL